MDLSIIIVAYRNKNLLRENLKCLKQAGVDLSYEIIVVDNNSQDGTVKMLRFEFPEVITIAASKNLGFAAGNNLGVKQAKGEKIFFLNPDIVVTRGSIEKMAAYLDSNPEVGLVGPKLLNPDGTLQYSAFRFPTFFTPIFRRTPLGLFSFGKKHLKKYLMTNWNHNETKEVDWLLGSTLMMRKKDYGRPSTKARRNCHSELVSESRGNAFGSHSLDSDNLTKACYGAGIAKFDERFFLYFDDCDLARQVWQNGKKVVYFPQAQMIHFHRRESAHFGFIKGLFHKPTREHVKSWIKYFRKYRL